ncbi:class I SAM-dependent methyltransferase [Rhizobium sp. Td3]|nr:class I SAM-dependent methyltransferase [Rhizobium sp. RM]TMV20018.1 class I SAM-dependent methyltransferase [Rhizobium sp. Td3]
MQVSDSKYRTVPNCLDQRAIYRYWAPVYDIVYSLFLRRAQRTLAARAAEVGRDILEVGVGTGLILPFYPPDSRVTGIDISAEMLERATRKKEKLGLAHVMKLEVMDACNMKFPDRSFDVICIPFVLPLVPDPDALLNECARIVRPGGEIIIVSKLTESAGGLREFEEFISPVARKLGLSSAFRSEMITRWLSQSKDVSLVENTRIRPVGFFRLIRLASS